MRAHPFVLGIAGFAGFAVTSAPPAPGTQPVAADPAAAIATATESAYAATVNARFDVDDPAAVAALDPWFTVGSPARRQVDAVIELVRAAPVREQPIDTVPATLTVEQVVPGTGPAAFRAGVVACAVEAFRPMQPGSDQVAGSDHMSASRIVYELRDNDGTWQLFDSFVLGTWDGPTCPAPDELQTVEAAIAMRVQEIDAVRVAAVIDLNTDEALLSSLMTRDGDTYAGTLEYVEYLRSSGLRLRTRQDVPLSTTVESIRLEDGPASTNATVVSCAVDSVVTVEPLAAPDGSDIVVDDNIAAYRLEWTLLLDSGVWKLDLVTESSTEVWAGVECLTA